MVRILDASVALKWFLIEPGHGPALELLKELLNKPRTFAVPELFFFEVLNVFPRVIPAPSKDQLSLLSFVVGIPIQRFSMTLELMENCRTFQSLGLSGYDGAYVGLAKLLKGKWVTSDAKAHSKIEHLKVSILLDNN